MPEIQQDKYFLCYDSVMFVFFFMTQYHSIRDVEINVVPLFIIYLSENLYLNIIVAI